MGTNENVCGDKFDVALLHTLMYHKQQTVKLLLHVAMRCSIATHSHVPQTTVKLLLHVAMRCSIATHSYVPQTTVKPLQCDVALPTRTISPARVSSVVTSVPPQHRACPSLLVHRGLIEKRTMMYQWQSFYL